MMNNGSCLPPCYEDEDDCQLTVVKVFFGKHSQSKKDPPILYPINPIIWHGSSFFSWFPLIHSMNSILGSGPPRDRTNQTIRFEHIHLSVFISISVCSAVGLFVSCGFLAFNIHYRTHR